MKNGTFHNIESGPDKAGVVKTAAVCLALIFVNLIIYSQIQDFGMVHLEEKEVAVVLRDGITRQNLEKIFIESTNLDGYCQPVAFISCMLVMELFGPDPGNRHLVNLFLHLASTLLLFWFFRRASGNFWPSAMVAGLFAAHPINVAPVVWLANHESGLNLFFLTALLVVYSYYVKSRAKISYIVIVFLFLLAMLSHPRVVAFPFLLLLLDYWPLARYRSSRSQPYRPDFSENQRFWKTGFYLKEKAPLFGISALAVLDGLYRLSVGPVQMGTKISLLPAALVSYGAYLGRLFLLPGIYHNRYLMPHPVSGWQVLLSAAVLTMITAGVVYGIKRGYPFLVAGWGWFLVVMAPAVLMDAGKQELFSERYAYLGAVGIFVLIVWGGRSLLQRTIKTARLRRLIAAALGVLLIAALTLSARSYARNWRNSDTLLAYTLDVMPSGRIFHKRAGDVLLENGRLPEAIKHFHLALEQTPEAAAAVHVNLGIAYMKNRELVRAVHHLETALCIEPANANALHNLGNALLTTGKIAEAIVYFRRALEINPASYRTYNSLATAFLNKGEVAKAILCLKQALALQPAYETARKNLKRLEEAY